MISELFSCLGLLIVGPVLGLAVFCVFTLVAAIANDASKALGTITLMIAFALGGLTALAGIIKAFVIFVGVLR